MKARSSALLFACACTAGASALAAPPNECVQDQYGNQYNLVYDGATQSITGTVNMVQCPGSTWSMIGSYTKKGGVRTQEITAAADVTDAACVVMIKLKGAYPNFAWYYTTGYGAQESTYSSCSADAASAGQQGGALR